jgi:transcription initiation factor TFIIA small subunit
LGKQWLTKDSLGGALTDTLDSLITERRIEPQLAMKILINFDKAVADGLAEKVKTRLTFKVSLHSVVCEHAN